MTNRERLERAARDIARVQANLVISPTPFSHLTGATLALERAGQFALDEHEQDRAHEHRSA